MGRADAGNEDTAGAGERSVNGCEQRGVTDVRSFADGLLI